MSSSGERSRVLVRDLRQVVSPVGTVAPLRGAALSEVDVLEEAFVLCEDGRIAEVGRMRDLGALGGDIDEVDGRGLCAITRPRARFERA